MKDDV